MGRQKLDKNTWLAERKYLNKSYSYSDKWGKVIDLFRNRIYDYYFNPIDAIIELNIRKGEGFSIVTLQCAMIEMFAAFKIGKIYNRKKRDNGLKFEYKSSHECFVEFLRTEEIFENHFYSIENNNKLPDKPFNANEFYDKVRCGLMHEAKTKDEWLINTSINNASSIFIIKNELSKTISIYRTILQNRLKEYFNKYLGNLKQNSQNGEILRRYFARKLDHLL